MRERAVNGGRDIGVRGVSVRVSYSLWGVNYSLC